MEAFVGLIFFVVLLVIGLAIALIPFFIANKRNHQYKWVILVLCLFAGTGICWIAAFVWAVWPQDKSALAPISSPTGKE